MVGLQQGHLQKPPPRALALPFTAVCSSEKHLHLSRFALSVNCINESSNEHNLLPHFVFRTHSTVSSCAYMGKTS